MSTEVIRAAGGVVWRPTEGGLEVAVVHRPRYDDWSLPKGKLDPGEHPLGAACREVIEETGLQPLVGPRLPSTSYLVAGVHGTQPKTVDYWSMRATGGEFAPNDEVDGLTWLSPVEAAARVTHQHDAEVLGAFAALPALTGSVLLVRHAKAGDAVRWAGADKDRPLEPSGQAQAVWLATLLPWFGPDRVLSAAKVRCQQTVEPLADGLGQTVETDLLFDEETFYDDRDGVLERIRGLGAGGGVSVVCSQGGLIPGSIAALAESDNARVDASASARRRDGQLRSRKGSVWVLSFAGRRLVQADYLASLRPE
jgi:8-oxo-dGTP pyrophosphatase MutT (NUDIX family)/phosphohistidine phosphatase SixA